MFAIPSIAAAMLGNRSLRISQLFEFDFQSGLKRYFAGTGTLVTGGFEWAGIPAIIDVDYGRYAVDGAAEAFTVGVSGVDADFVAGVRAEESEAIGRRVRIWWQVFDDDWQVLDQPFVVRTGRMRGFRFVADGPKQRSVTVMCESLFSSRGKPPLAFLSDVEQQARYPGDPSLEFVPAMQNKTAAWPVPQ